MALKNYKRETLTGNWFEERAPPLRGVMPDYGDRCFTTQASQDYPPVRREQITSRPEKLAKLVRGNHSQSMMRWRMVGQTVRFATMLLWWWPN